jgi:prepilin-type N-terminal cleavage/methylation domain-containing protein/prepilin-type processing-associated H-X9-DG protein
MRRWALRRGFTLTELLVVIAITAVLIGLLLPAVQKVRDAAFRADCANNLRQIGTALHSYHGTHGALPPGCSFQNGRDPSPHLSWCARLLPFLEQEPLWRETERAFAQERFFQRPPHTALEVVVPVFICPADGRVRVPRDFRRFKAAFTSYLGVEGVNQSSRDGVLFLDSRVRLADVTDGTSNTLMVGERPPSANLTAGWWYAGWGQDKDGSVDMVLGVRERNTGGYYRTDCPPGPYGLGPGRLSDPCAAFHFWSLHSGGGAHFLFADGAVRFLRYSAAPVMPALATRAGGESVEVP